VNRYNLSYQIFYLFENARDPKSAFIEYDKFPLSPLFSTISTGFDMMFIDPSVLENLAIYRQAFESARPFPHVVIDNFFVVEYAKKLLDRFPIFDASKAIAETGNVGGKAVNENLTAMGDIYGQLAEYLESRPFLETISAITGIDRLINDPTFYGGGTHENLHGQELDPHVDFNIDERGWYYRRLNLLLYLNEDWSEDWGGALELHSNPREPKENQIFSFTPIFNRCVIFETSDDSWHGFSQIQLPSENRHLSRKSISVYLYTQEPPSGKAIASHTTFYVHRPLPERIQPGRVLTEEDHQQIEILLKRRDDLIRFYQDREIAESRDPVSFKSRVKRYLSLQYPQIWQVFTGIRRWKSGR
jgi:2OG-Fe(II) oxygenase superfamily